MENKELLKAKLDTVRMLDEYLDALVEDVMAVSQVFRDNDVEVGINYIKFLVEGFQMVCEAVDGSSDILKGKIDLRNFIDKIKEMISGVNDQDYVLVADLLEYEISPILQSIKLITFNTIN